MAVYILFHIKLLVGCNTWGWGTVVFLVTGLVSYTQERGALTNHGMLTLDEDLCNEASMLVILMMLAFNSRDYQ